MNPAPAWHTLAAAALLSVCASCEETPYPEVRVDFTGAKVPEGPRVTDPASTLRFSVAAMQSPQDTHAAYSQLVERLGALLGIRIDLIQRRTYREVNDQLASGRLDAALVCTGGYLDLERRHPGAVQAIAVPVVQGRTAYRSYIIVPADSRAQSLRDLEGKRFAYTDELSLSGFLYPTRLLASWGRDPGTYFADTAFTRSHDRSAEAVAKRAVDGAAVDSLVYDQLVRSSPSLGATTRIIQRSPPYGISPVVVARHVPPERRQAIQDALLHIEADPRARAALRQLGFDRFDAPAAGLYRDAAALLGMAP